MLTAASAWFLGAASFLAAAAKGIGSDEVGCLAEAGECSVVEAHGSVMMQVSSSYSMKHTGTTVAGRSSRRAAATQLHRHLAQHVGDKPLKPGLVHGGELAREWQLEPSKPDYHTEEVEPPWEQGVEALARCPEGAAAVLQAGATAAGTGAADRSLEAALGIFCELSTMRPLVEFYVDPRYQKNYEKFRDADGWIEKAFVTYMGLRTSDDQIGAEEDLLVQSIHHFSRHPIVVTNFNRRVPKSWSPERFPNLVLMHARKSTTEVRVSFNFNKITAMLFAKVKAGLVLDADQFANHGLDVMLDRAAEETTEAYPYPIMPVHWMTRDPEASDMKDYPDGYTWHFKSKDAPNRTMRWGHAHPTFAHPALPWLAHWTKCVMVPEEAGCPKWLMEQGGVEDEDLLNVALWASGATKQWCKYDLPGNGDFVTYKQQSPAGVFFADSKYYPKGIGYIFFTSHDGKDPEKSFNWLNFLWDDIGDRRKAILYDRRWFGSGKALQAYDPNLRCIA